MENTIVCGLCEGRHVIPGVSEYIFPNTVENIFDSDALEERFFQFYAEHGGKFRTEFGAPANAAGYDDIELYRGDKAVQLYVTGLTPVLTAVMRCCWVNGIKLNLMHYDRDSGTYISQKFNF